MVQNKGKIGIFTFAKGDNYGAVLQAYALKEVLVNMGYKVVFIHLTWDTWKYKILSLFTPLSRRFDSFRKEFLGSFTKECHTKEDLVQVSRDFDYCIMGSDQIWNPTITTHRALFYFGDFLPDYVKRLSYAASFGYSEWKFPELTEDIKNCLKRFNAISVREDEAVDICRNTFEREAVKVLDPTLLYGNFSALLEKPSCKGSVVGFKFSPSIMYYNLLHQIANELDTVPLLMDGLSKTTLKSGLFMNRSWFPSPQTWVTNIANARFVVTDSFHCMAFSIIFNKEFVVIPSNPALQSRMTSLLSDLGLSDRLFNSHEEVLNSKIWYRSIDYTQVNKKLEVLRKKSMDFLREALI